MSILILLSLLMSLPAIFHLWVLARSRRSRADCEGGRATATIVIPARGTDVGLALANPHADDAVLVVDGPGAVRRGRLAVRRAEPWGYKAGALNDALPHLEGDYLVVLDADAELTGDMSRCLCPEYDYVVPAWTVKNRGASPLAAAQDMGYRYYMEFLGALHSAVGWAPVLGSGTAVRRDALVSVGGWPISVLEDVDLGIVMFLRGRRMRFDDRCRVSLEAPPDYWAFVLQQARWAYGTGELLRKRAIQVLASERPLRAKAAILMYLSQYFPYAALLATYAYVALAAPLPGPHVLGALTILLGTSAMYTYSFCRRTGRFPRCLYSANTVNQAYALAAPRIAAGLAMGLLGLPYRWVPTPKGSARAAGNMAVEHAYAVTLMALIAYALSVGPWTGLLALVLSLPALRGYYRLVRGSL